VDPTGLRVVIEGEAADGRTTPGSGNRVPMITVPLGGLEARTEPLVDGIQVFVDERPVGNAPVSLDSLSPGRHRVRFASAEGYHWEEEVMVRADEVSHAVAPFSEGEAIALISLRTSTMSDEGRRPENGSPVIVDGEPKGETPVDLPMEPGVHGITVERTGAPPIHRVVELRRGDRLILNLRVDELPPTTIEHAAPAQLAAGETIILTAICGGIRPSSHQKLHLNYTIDGGWTRRAMGSIPGAPGTYAIGLPVPPGPAERNLRYYFSTEADSGQEVVTPIFRIGIR
jgi:hypothetical protein